MILPKLLIRLRLLFDLMYLHRYLYRNYEYYKRKLYTLLIHVLHIYEQLYGQYDLPQFSMDNLE